MLQSSILMKNLSRGPGSIPPGQMSLSPLPLRIPHELPFTAPSQSGELLRLLIGCALRGLGFGRLKGGGTLFGNGSLEQQQQFLIILFG